MSRLRGRLIALRRDESGSAALSTALGIAFLVFPVLLLVATLPTWVERTVDARDAAANAARRLAQAPSWSAGVAAGNRVVDEVATNDGLNPSTVVVSYQGSLTAGATVTATVTVTIPAGRIPGIGSFGQWHYSSSSTQSVDSFRSGP